MSCEEPQCDVSDNRVTTTDDSCGYDVLLCEEPQCDVSDNRVTTTDDSGSYDVLSCEGAHCDVSDNRVTTTDDKFGYDVLSCEDPHCDVSDNRVTTTYDGFGYDVLYNEDMVSELVHSLQTSCSLTHAARKDIRKLNLDVSTLICLVSNLCHGHCHGSFQQGVLEDLAQQEREAPLLPTLLAFMKDKEWYVCRTAYNSFTKNLAIIGGPEEKERGRKLLEKITIIPDNVSEEVAQLKCSSKIKPRTKIVFGTGHSFHAITVSANNKFVRSVSNQGLNIAVYIHASRALSEQKEVFPPLRGISHC